MLQEVIRANIEAKLNNNTQSAVFVLGQYAKKDDEEFDYVFNIDNGYKLVEHTYIPGMMRFTAEYRAIPSSITGLASIPISFLVATDSEQSLKLEALEELISKVVGNSESVVDGSTTYNTVWNMEAITPEGGLQLLNGDYYIQLNTTIYIEFSNTFYFGNQWQYWLTGGNFSTATRIYPYSSKKERNMELQTPQILGEVEAKSLAESATWSATLVLWVNSGLSALLDSLNGSYNPETAYTLLIKTPTNASGYSATVIIQSFSETNDLGERATASITFMKQYA